MDVRIVTFNMHHGRGMDGKLNLNRTARLLEQCEADLIALNEVDRYFSRRSGYVDQISWLAKQLDMYWAFGAALTLRRKQSGIIRQYGNALLSRYPILSETTHAFHKKPFAFEGRSLLEVDIAVHGTPFKIFVTHLSLNPYSRNKQIKSIIGLIARVECACTVMGDWNLSHRSRTWKTVTAYLKDACAEIGPGECGTFPSIYSKWQLDYIFVSKNIQVKEARVIRIDPGASDHLPLSATIVL
ncbi:endonuclease/exonuclease/phosphatase family protein [Paenibacillus tarimensis]